MSNLSVNTITDALGGSTASINGLTPQASNMAATFNRIINGAMTIDQRNAGAAVSANGAYPTDRWQLGISGGTWSVQQSSTAPEGFSKSMGITITTGYTKSVSDQNNFRQFVEGNNLSDADFGLSSAKSLTLSFWVRSSLTGTFSGSAMNSAYDRSYVFTYSISSANTWEYKTITIAGDTSGTWLTTTGVGLRLFFDLGSGSNSESASGSWLAGEYRRVAGAVDLVGTSGATFYITGVQLEAGSNASSFAHENVGDTLRKCQRYYYKLIGNGTNPPFIIHAYSGTADNYDVNQIHPVNMRTSPTGTVTGTFTNSNCGSPSVAYTAQNQYIARVSTSGTGMFYSFMNANTQIIEMSAEL